MKAFRLNRLLNARTGRCLVVAVDRGLVSGGENIEPCVRTLAAAGPDALQLTLGQAELLQSIPGRDKPALILRADVSNVHRGSLPRALFSRMIGNAAEQAVRLDAACVVVSLFHIPGQPKVTDQCIENIRRLRPECERFAVPMMIEALVFRPDEQAGGYSADGDAEKIVPLVRQAGELGADIIQTDPTDDAGTYHRVVEIAGRTPVLAGGGGGAPDAEILGRAEKLIAQGAAGIAFGRSVIRHADPAGMTRALMAVVHEGASRQATGSGL
jgi:DhnA family fructose-bisphosphate aldolase class Ia